MAAKRVIKNWRVCPKCKEYKSSISYEQPSGEFARKCNVCKHVDAPNKTTRAGGGDGKFRAKCRTFQGKLGRNKS